VGIGKESCGLYILDKDLGKGIVSNKGSSSAHNNAFHLCCNNMFTTGNKNPISCCNHTSQKLNIDIWHKRMGHIAYRKMKFLSLNADFAVPDVPCAVCPMAKQQRLPFSLSTISTSAPFELIRVDTWGPYHSTTHVGHRFFWTIVDDFIRATWTHLMVTKDEAIGLIKSFVSMAQM